MPDPVTEIVDDADGVDVTRSEVPLCGLHLGRFDRPTDHRRPPWPGETGRRQAESGGTAPGGHVVEGLGLLEEKATTLLLEEPRGEGGLRLEDDLGEASLGLGGIDDERAGRERLPLRRDVRERTSRDLDHDILQREERGERSEAGRGLAAGEDEDASRPPRSRAAVVRGRDKDAVSDAAGGNSIGSVSRMSAGMIWSINPSIVAAPTACNMCGRSDGRGPM